MFIYEIIYNLNMNNQKYVIERYFCYQNLLVNEVKFLHFTSTLTPNFRQPGGHEIHISSLDTSQRKISSL